MRDFIGPKHQSMQILSIFFLGVRDAAKTKNRWAITPICSMAGELNYALGIDDYCRGPVDPFIMHNKFHRNERREPYIIRESILNILQDDFDKLVFTELPYFDSHALSIGLAGKLSP